MLPHMVCPLCTGGNNCFLLELSRYFTSKSVRVWEAFHTRAIYASNKAIPDNEEETCGFQKSISKPGTKVENWMSMPYWRLLGESLGRHVKLRRETFLIRILGTQNMICTSRITMACQMIDKTACLQISKPTRIPWKWWIFVGKLVKRLDSRVLTLMLSSMLWLCDIYSLGPAKTTGSKWKSWRLKTGSLHKKMNR